MLVPRVHPPVSYRRGELAFEAMTLGPERPAAIQITMRIASLTKEQRQPKPPRRLSSRPAAPFRIVARFPTVSMARETAPHGTPPQAGG